jgi:drug/metabolite transporter (DMT)-like permease
MIVISSAAVLIRLCDDAGAAAIAAARMGIATLVLLPVAAARGRRILSIPPHCRGFILLSGIFLAAHFYLWMSSLKQTSVMSSVVIVTTNPIFVGLASYFLFKERVGSGLCLGILLAAVGGAVIALSDTHTGPTSLRGDGLSLCGALMASCYLLVGRKVRRDVDTLPYILPVYGIAAILLCAVAAGQRESWWEYRATTYVYLVLLALGPQLLGHSTLNWGLRHLSATFIAVCILAEPVGATLLAYFLLDEKIDLLQGIGAVLILAGIFLAAKAQFLPADTAARAVGRTAGRRQVR